MSEEENLGTMHDSDRKPLWRQRWESSENKLQDTNLENTGSTKMLKYRDQLRVYYSGPQALWHLEFRPLLQQENHFIIIVQPHPMSCVKWSSAYLTYL